MGQKREQLNSRIKCHSPKLVRYIKKATSKKNRRLAKENPENANSKEREGYAS